MLDIFTTIFKYKEKKSPDKLGNFPEKVHVEAMPERRYLWTSRILVIITTFSICLNMMLASTLYVMLPQRGAGPQLFYIDNYFSQIERLQEIEVDYPVGNAVTESYISNYIMMRYIVTSDYDELQSRWGLGSYLYWYSTTSVFRDFIENDAKINMALFQQNNMTRDVEIDWIKPLSRGLWQVQFKTLDYIDGASEPDINIWRATMRVKFVDLMNRTKNDAIKNPFGFIVTKFSLSYLGKTNKAEHYLSHTKRITKELFFR